MEIPLNEKEQQKVDRWLKEVNYVIEWLNGRKHQYSEMHSSVLLFKQELDSICTVWQYDVMQIKATKTINGWNTFIETHTFDEFGKLNIF